MGHASIGNLFPIVRVIGAANNRILTQCKVWLQRPSASAQRLFDSRRADARGRAFSPCPRHAVDKKSPDTAADCPSRLFSSIAEPRNPPRSISIPPHRASAFGYKGCPQSESDNRLPKLLRMDMSRRHTQGAPVHRLGEVGLYGYRNLRAAKCGHIVRESSPPLIQ